MDHNNVEAWKIRDSGSRQLDNRSWEDFDEYEILIQQMLFTNCFRGAVNKRNACDAEVNRQLGTVKAHHHQSD
jgi:hypothetical protein